MPVVSTVPDYSRLGLPARIRGGRLTGHYWDRSREATPDTALQPPLCNPNGDPLSTIDAPDPTPPARVSRFRGAWARRAAAACATALVLGLLAGNIVARAQLNSREKQLEETELELADATQSLTETELELATRETELSDNADAAAEAAAVLTQFDALTSRATTAEAMARALVDWATRANDANATLTECAERSLNPLSGVDLVNPPDFNEILTTTEETTHLCHVGVEQARTLGDAPS